MVSDEVWGFGWVMKGGEAGWVMKVGVGLGEEEWGWGG